MTQKMLIEKLEKENKELKERIKKYEDPEDLTLMFMYCDEKAKDKIKELKERIDKAIEYASKNPHPEWEQVVEDVLVSGKTVLNILRGE